MIPVFKVQTNEHTAQKSPGVDVPSIIIIISLIQRGQWMVFKVIILIIWCCQVCGLMWDQGMRILRSKKEVFFSESHYKIINFYGPRHLPSTTTTTAAALSSSSSSSSPSRNSCIGLVLLLLWLPKKHVRECK